MSAETREEKQDLPRKLTPEEKRHEHIIRIKRTVIACLLGVVAGIISYLVVDTSNILGFQSYTLLALMIMLAAVVVQKHIFMLLKLDPSKMGKKDWLFQGFMVFAFWFIVWTIFLTSSAQ
ncbi:MAG TPA: hypothetical protein VMW63_10335 [Methanoregulaceae archaeon]|nr:hypothetical protein [Methanoregulaceae archaeon]